MRKRVIYRKKPIFLKLALEIKRKKNRQAYKKQPGEYHGKELGNKKNPREVLYSY